MYTYLVDVLSGSSELSQVFPHQDRGLDSRVFQAWHIISWQGFWRVHRYENLILIIMIQETFTIFLIHDSLH